LPIFIPQETGNKMAEEGKKKEGKENKKENYNYRHFFSWG
jgi:hypothetical protein